MIYRQLSSCSACVSAHSFQLQATTFILARFLAPGGHQLGALPVRGRKWPAGGESVAQKKAGGFRRGPRPSRLDCRAWPGERGKATPLVRLNSLACLSETPKYAKYAFDFTKDNCKIGNFDHVQKRRSYFSEISGKTGHGFSRNLRRSRFRFYNCRGSNP